MKISVFGKSGPSVVSCGLVCANSPVDPLMVASTITNARNIFGIAVSLRLFAAAYHGARIFRNPRVGEYDMGSAQPELFRHVDAECGLSRGSLRRPAEARGACPHSGRRGLAGDRP